MTGGNTAQINVAKTWTATQTFADIVTEDINLLDTNNIVISGGTGSKIGTGTLQKIGFWNTTPVVQQVHVADPTNLATCITAITAINAKDAVTGLTAAS